MSEHKAFAALEESDAIALLSSPELRFVVCPNNSLPNFLKQPQCTAYYQRCLQRAGSPDTSAVNGCPLCALAASPLCPPALARSFASSSARRLTAPNPMGAADSAPSLRSGGAECNSPAKPPAVAAYSSSPSSQKLSCSPYLLSPPPAALGSASPSPSLAPLSLPPPPSTFSLSASLASLVGYAKRGSTPSPSPSTAPASSPFSAHESVVISPIVALDWPIPMRLAVPHAVPACNHANLAALAVAAAARTADTPLGARQQAVALNNLAVCCLYGIGTPAVPREDYTRRVTSLFVCAALLGSAAARNNIGVCFLRGIGVERNEERAAQIFQNETDRGHLMAQVNLGRCYLFGDGVTKEEKRAVLLFQDGHKRAFNLATYSLAKCYEHGAGVLHNSFTAYSLCLFLAETGDLNAVFKLAYMYHQSDGAVEQDLDKAAEYYQQTVILGEGTAREKLLEVYQMAETVQGRSLPERVAAWHHAAEAGDCEAQVFLGLCHQFGCVVPKALDKAEHWFAAAAAQGDTFAQLYLDRIRQPGLLSPAVAPAVRRQVLDASPLPDVLADIVVGYLLLPLRPGDVVDALDCVGKWSAARVVDVVRQPDNDLAVRVHYLGWSDRWDERMFWSEQRIDLFGSHEYLPHAPLAHPHASSIVKELRKRGYNKLVSKFAVVSSANSRGISLEAAQRFLSHFGEKVDRLARLGFDIDEIGKALRMTSGNATAAENMLYQWQYNSSHPTTPASSAAAAAGPDVEDDDGGSSQLDGTMVET